MANFPGPTAVECPRPECCRPLAAPDFSQPPKCLPDCPAINAEAAPDLRLAQSKLLEMFGLGSDSLVDRRRLDLKDWDLEGDGGSGSNSSRSRPPNNKNSNSPSVGRRLFFSAVRSHRFCGSIERNRLSRASWMSERTSSDYPLRRRFNLDFRPFQLSEAHLAGG